MNKLKRTLALILAAAAVGCSVSCSKKNGEGNSQESSLTDATEAPTEPDDGTKNQTIYWLADYDINPAENESRSVALSLFEDVYGGKVEWIQTNPNDKFTTLDQRILSDQPVDMFPYEDDCLPNGVTKNHYQPLDNYFDILDIDSDLWSGMQDVINMFEYKGAHYVVPYSLSDPQLIIYSRQLMKDEELDDPFELYEKGEWDWDAMMDMMETFVSNAPEKSTRFGIKGAFGQSLLRSTGQTVVNYNNGSFSNNIENSEIEKAELLLGEIAEKKLYNPDADNCYFPEKLDTLFLCAGDWVLGASNAKNPDADLMAVPFPKSPNADNTYITCSFGAKMLVQNSDKGAAVAAYIKCERLAAENEEYKKAAKDKALAEEKTVSGDSRKFVTEEQYDAIQSYLDPANVAASFDFGCGMGEKMYGCGEYTYETRGVIDKLETAMLENRSEFESWEELRDELKLTVDQAVGEFNAK